MSAIENLIHYNWFSVVLALISAMIAFKFLSDLFGWFVTKFGLETKYMREKRESQELIKATAKNLASLENRHTKDEREFRENLNNYIKESRADRKALHDEMKRYSQNRISDRQQSIQIQTELKDSIKEMAKAQEDRDNQIAALMEGSKELLGDKIDQRYDKYISLGGIPQNEVDEFDSIYEAYRGLNGNHGRKTKYEYVKNNLPVLPVKTEVVLNKDWG